MLACGVAERVGGPKGARAVPRSARELDAQWLSAVLCARIPDGRVTGVRSAASSVGTTSRARLEVTYNEAGAAAGLPTRVFVKCTAALAQRLMLGLGGLIDGEPGFYNHVRPRLELEAPVGYFAAVDPRSWRSVVITEDVAATRGARFWVPGAQVSRAQVEDLLAGAAGWHAALWDSPLLTRWRWLKTPAEQMQVIDALIGVLDRTPAGFERARSVIPPALHGRRMDLFDGMRRAMTLASQSPRTYLHGDLHIANTYLSSAGAMGVVDWQVGMQGSWAHDCAYLIATALSVENRRAWERELLSSYREALRAAGGPAIAPDAAWRAYRAALLYPCFAWLYTLGRSRLQPRFQPEAVCLTIIQRLATAIDDLDALRAVGS